MTASKDNGATLAAIAVIAMCVSTAAHEAVGHGGFCLASGGRISQLTSVYFHCQPNPWPIALGGPIGNIAWGLIAAAIASNLRGTLRLLFTLTSLFSLFWEAGYMLYAALLNDGDYVFALRGMFGEATPLMRAILGGLGAALYLIAANLGRTLLHPFATEPERIRDMTRVALLAAALAALGAALMYAPDRFGAAKQALLEIGAASLPLLLLGHGAANGNAARVSANILWLVAAVAFYAAFTFALGFGIGV